MIKENNYIDFKVEDIKRVKFFIPECMEHALVSYGKTLNVDFIKAFAESWRFDFEEKEDDGHFLFGESIRQNGDILNDYEKYNGVRVSCIKVKNALSLIDVIEKNCKDGLPTLIHMDTYYSYWGFLFGKIHSEHIAVAVGVNREKRKLCIVDPDFSEESFWIDFEMLERATEFYLLITIVDSEKYTYHELLKLLCNQKEKYLAQFERIKLSAKKIREEFNPQKEFKEYNNIDDMLNSAVINNIRDIIKGRNLFIIFLEQILKQYDNIYRVIEYIYISMGKWNTIMNLFFKAARTEWKKDFGEKLSNILVSIAEIEGQAYELLCNCKKDSINGQDLTRKIFDVSCINIDISKYCNNKGFVFDEQIEQGVYDLTSAGEYIVLEKEFKNILYNNIAFKTCFENKFDNVICNGQTIKILNKKKIYSLEFLVCAEWGSCEDSVFLKSIDGKLFPKKIVANDISDIESKYWIQIGKSKKLNGEVVNQKVGLTYNKIILDLNIECKEIELPINPNMHLIALSALCYE